ncbi:MAG: ATP-binding protein [bacterium]
MEKDDKYLSMTNRRKAEELISRKEPEDISRLSLAEIRKLIHELEVHQVELDMKNDELRHAWASAEVASNRYAELYDFAPTGYATLNKDGRIEGINLYGAQLLGRERSRLKDVPLNVFISDDTLPAYNELTNNVFTKRGVRKCDVIFSIDGKAPVYVQLSAIAGNLGEECFVTMVDNTERINAERDRHEISELLSLFLEYSPIYAYIKEVFPTGSRVLKASENFTEMLGIPGSAMVGKTMDELFPAEHAAKLNADDLVVMSGKKAVTIEEYFNGRTYTTIKYPIAKGDRHLLAGYSIDITKEKQANSQKDDMIVKLAETELLLHMEQTSLEHKIEERTRELNLLNQKLTFRIEEAEQFTYITSHDLQEPLLTLTSYSQLIREEYGGKLDETANKSLDFIAGSATRMSSLLKGLLDYSFLGKDCVITELKCNHIVDDTLAELRNEIAEHNVKIIVQELPVINGSDPEIRFLFRHLVSNAIKFRRQGVSPEITISAQKQAGSWCFSVEDNGIGIEEKQRNKVFLIFNQLHNKGVYEGTGMGLAQCKKIVELHGGQISVESTPGKGSIFTFTLSNG